METKEIDFILEALTSAVCRAVTEYVGFTGEVVDHIPEFVMSVGAFNGLRALDIATVLEVRADSINRRSKSRMSNDTEAEINSAVTSLKSGRVDLVVLDGGGEPAARPAVGFIEFKLWQEHDGDAKRIESLLKEVPEAQFGARIILHNTPAHDDWVDKFYRPNYSFDRIIAKDVPVRALNRQTCCAVCLAWLH